MNMAGITQKTTTFKKIYELPEDISPLAPTHFGRHCTCSAILPNSWDPSKSRRKKAITYDYGLKQDGRMDCTFVQVRVRRKLLANQIAAKKAQLYEEFLKLSTAQFPAEEKLSMHNYSKLWLTLCSENDAGLAQRAAKAIADFTINNEAGTCVASATTFKQTLLRNKATQNRLFGWRRTRQVGLAKLFDWINLN
jgi:hypothetical protein